MYKVADYLIGEKDGLRIGLYEDFKTAKLIADDVRLGHEREVTKEIDGKVIQVYNAIP